MVLIQTKSGNGAQNREKPSLQSSHSPNQLATINLFTSIH